MPVMAPDVSASAARAATVLVYSDDADIRDRVRTALGRKPARDVVIEYVEAAGGREVMEICDGGGIDLAILDGEATPTGGIGLGRQIKDEVDNSPPVLVIVGRHDDAWLAAWAKVDGAVRHPIDAVELTDAVLALLRPRLPQTVG
jgi:DNA-binding response OmpR family regulator